MGLLGALEELFWGVNSFGSVPRGVPLRPTPPQLFVQLWEGAELLGLVRVPVETLAPGSAREASGEPAGVDVWYWQGLRSTPGVDVWYSAALGAQSIQVKGRSGAPQSSSELRSSAAIRKCGQVLRNGCLEILDRDLEVGRVDVGGIFRLHHVGLAP